MHKSANPKAKALGSLLFVAPGGIRRPEPHVNFGAKRRKIEARQGREHLVDLEAKPNKYT